MNAFKLWYRSQPVALRTLIAINVAFYLAWLFLLGNVGITRAFVSNHLALNPALPGVLLEAWQLVTYNFLHFTFLHVLFNMLWLWWIGREFEDLHGPHEMLALYLIGGIGGGVFSVLGYALVAGGAPHIIGASASVLALMVAVVTLYPQKRIRLLFLGNVRLLYVVGVYLALDVVTGLAGTSGNTAILAHLGGAASGYLFVRAGERGVDLTSWAKVFFSGRGRSHGGYAPGRSAGGGSSGGGGFFGGGFFGGGASGGPSRRETLRQERDRKKAEQSRRREEVDRILDKISAEGYEALSDEEKRTLEDASRQ